MSGLQVFEIKDHLFLHCPFAQVCWSYICPNRALNYLGIQDEIAHIKTLLVVPFAMELLFLIPGHMDNKE